MINEVYNNNAYEVKRAKQAMSATSETPFTFQNMPRNVFLNTKAAAWGGTWVFSGNKTPLALSDMMRVHDMFPELLLYLSGRYTHYSFCVTTTLDTAAAHQALPKSTGIREVHVFHNEEALGLISRASGGALRFQNNRVRNDMSRGTGKKTTKLNVAKSIFAKYFYGLTITEHMQNITGNIQYEVSSKVHEAERQWGETKKSIIACIDKELNKGNQLVVEFLNALNKRELYDNHNLAAHLLTDAKAFKKQLNKDEGYYTLLQGDEYLCWRKGDKAKRLKRKEMPKNTRMALGLLKLSEAKTFVHGVGFKLEDDKFFIFDEVQREHDN